MVIIVSIKDINSIENVNSLVEISILNTKLKS
jgi:hypothetical protein